jgi:hypothetical protein
MNAQRQLGIHCFQGRRGKWPGGECPRDMFDCVIPPRNIRAGKSV